MLYEVITRRPPHAGRDSRRRPTSEEFHEEPGGMTPEGRPVRYFLLLSELTQPLN